MINLSDINPMTFQLILSFMLMMNPNLNATNSNNINNTMENFLKSNPFVYQLFMNYQNNNNTNLSNKNMDILKATSEKIKNASKKGGILPREKNNNSNNQIFDAFPGNTHKCIVLMFMSGTGTKTPMNVPINVSLHDVFIAFIHKVNLDESVLGTFIYFLNNGKKLPINEKKNS
jgi:hypothetical protein